MADIRITYQKPDDIEAHDVLNEDEVNIKKNGSSSENGLLNVTNDRAINDIQNFPISSTLAVRRGSSLSVSPHPTASSIQIRKFSFPAALPSSLLGLEPTGVGISARRRFSNVSDAVSRKLSHTIANWRTTHMPYQEIVAIGKSLCNQYIRNRLKRSGFLNKKCGLQRLKSAVSLSGGGVFREIYTAFLGLGVELERLHPKLYVNVTRQASSLPGGKLTSEKEVGVILTSVYRELYKSEMTWGKVVSLYAVAGGLAVDCVRQNHFGYLTSVVEAMEDILEDELAHWIQCKGGWNSLAALVRPPTSKWPPTKLLIFLSSLLTIMICIVFILRHFGISDFCR